MIDPDAPSPVDDETGTAPPRRSRARLVAIVCVALGAVLVGVSVVGRGSSNGGAEPEPGAPKQAVAADLAAGTTAPTTPAGLGAGTVPERAGRSPLRGFGEVAVTVTRPDGTTCELCLLSAISAPQRARGLMEVTDEGLGGYDGMLFEFPGKVDGAFWMRNTPMPLSIAYFDPKGGFVSSTDMEPCDDVATCPTFPASAPFQYALEVPQGNLGDTGAVEGATLRIDARTCPLAGAGS